MFGDDQRGGGGAVRVRDLDLVVRFGVAEDEGEPGAVRDQTGSSSGTPLVKWVTWTARLNPCSGASGSITKRFLVLPPTPKFEMNSTFLPSGDQTGFSSMLVSPLSVRLVTAAGFAGSSRQMSSLLQS